MTLPKTLGFRSFLNVDYAPGQDPLIKKNAKKRKGNETETSGPMEATQIDELSKDTLRSYLNKAVPDFNKTRKAGERLKDPNKIVRAAVKVRNRAQGVMTASRKMSEDLDEGRTHVKTSPGHLQKTADRIGAEYNSDHKAYYKSGIKIGYLKPRPSKINPHTGGHARQEYDYYIHHRLKEEVDEEVSAKQTPRWRLHIVTKDGEKFKSAAYTDKNQADKMHWKLAKGNKHKSVTLVKEEDDLDEAVLTPQQRRLRAIQMRRLAPKLRLGQERAKNRFADLDRLKKRAMKAARTKVFQSLTKGIPKDELTYARRQEIEKRLDSPAMKARIERIAIKMLPAEREAEVARHQSKNNQDNSK